jgi:glycosyltransferase involved in cell wall biosynthesis
VNAINMVGQKPLVIPSLSVVIIAKNEAHNISDCVKSAMFSDEVIVLDSGSTDATVALAREAGARVIETDWPGFGLQKNRALTAAKSQWVFSLDADERITPELADQIRAAITSADAKQTIAFRVPRSSQFCGQFMRHSGWSPDYTVRLIKAGHGKFSEKQVHESLLYEGKCEMLTAPMLHYSYRNLDEVLLKLNHYSSAGAKDLAAQGRQSSVSAAVLHGAWAFLRTYVLKLGFLDGRLGFVLAIYNAEASYYKYLKLVYRNPSD